MPDREQDYFKTVTIYWCEETTANEDGDDVPRGEGLYKVEDDGGYFDDREQLDEDASAEAIRERLEHYRDRGCEVTIMKESVEITEADLP